MGKLQGCTIKVTTSALPMTKMIESPFGRSIKLLGRPVEPEPVPGGPVEVQEGVAIARGAVAEAVPLPQETPAPHKGARPQGTRQVRLTAPYLGVV